MRAIRQVDDEDNVAFRGAKGKFEIQGEVVEGKQMIGQAFT